MKISSALVTSVAMDIYTDNPAHDAAIGLKYYISDSTIVIDYQQNGIAQFRVDSDNPALLEGFTSKITKGLLRIHKQTSYFRSYDEETIKTVGDALTNVLRAMYDDWEFSIISSVDDVADAYSDEYAKVNGTSCMRSHYYVDLYADQPNVQILRVSQRGVYKGRALLWTCKNGEKVLDRCYPNDSLASRKMRQWAQERDYWVRSDDSLSDSEKSTSFYRNGEFRDNFKAVLVWRQNMPYMDSFRFFRQWPNPDETFEIGTFPDAITGQSVNNGFEVVYGKNHLVWAHCVKCGKKDRISFMTNSMIGWKHERCKEASKCSVCGDLGKKHRHLYNYGDKMICEACIVRNSDNLYWDQFFGTYRVYAAAYLH